MNNDVRKKTMFGSAFRSFICLGVALIMASCSSVTIRTDAQKESTAEPFYQESFDYWWWGLKGEYDVNVREICYGSKVEQLQSVTTLTDALQGLLTLGIYAPRSARVWCGEAVK